MKEKKEVSFTSNCDGTFSCKIQGATLSETLASIAMFINQVYKKVCTNKVMRDTFKGIFDMAYKTGIFFDCDDDGNEIELDDLDVLMDLLKRRKDR